MGLIGTANYFSLNYC